MGSGGADSHSAGQTGEFCSPGLRNCAYLRFQPHRKLIPPRSRNHQRSSPWSCPVVAALCGAGFVEELHVISGLGWRATEDRFAPRQKTRGLCAGRVRDGSELVEGLEKVLCRLIESLMGLVVQGAFVLDECRGDIAPCGVSSEEHDDITVAVFPTVLHDVVLSGRLHGLDLDTMVVRTVGNENIGFVPVIENGRKDLPSVLHQPTYDRAFVRGLLHDDVGFAFGLGDSSGHGRFVLGFRRRSRCADTV